MPSKYFITKLAERDIESAIKYIAETLHNQKAANDLFDKIEKAIENACFFPYAYSSSEYFFIHDLNVRHIIIDNYVLFYEVKDDKIIVMRFLLAKIDFSKITISE